MPLIYAIIIAIFSANYVDAAEIGHSSNPMPPAKINDAEPCSLARPSAFPNKIPRLVEMQLLIRADGSVGDGKITRPTDSQALDNATLNGATDCKFIPATHEGTAVDAWFSFIYDWRINYPYIAPTLQMKTCEMPRYPQDALRNNNTGTVKVAFLIDVNGDVRDSRLVRSSGFPLLDSAAKDGIEKCKFSPATDDGKRIEAWSIIQYKWTMD